MLNKLLVLLSILVFSSGVANALEISNLYCKSSSGKMSLTVHASQWDTVFHEHVIFKVYSYTSGQWKTLIKPLNHGRHRYSIDFMQEVDLVDVDNYKVLTKKATVVVGRCGQ